MLLVSRPAHALRLGLIRGLSGKVSADLVKQLRQRTGAPINKCKQALEAEGGDLDAAAGWLRKSGVATAQKKASRGANEGVVGVCPSSSSDCVALIELNSETDFVARNETFHTLAHAIAAAALRLAPAGDEAATAVPLEVEKVLGERISEPSSATATTVNDAIVDGITTLGENILLRRGALLRAPSGHVAHYVHNVYTPNLGRIAAAVALEAEGGLSEGARPAVAELGQQLAMHVVAASPVYLDRASIPAEKIAEESAVFRAQLADSKKPPNVLDKIVEGKLAKWCSETVLLEQEFVLEQKGRVDKLVAAKARELGVKLRVAGYVRYSVGDSSTSSGNGVDGS